jgi:hypothetical protein
MEMNITSAQYIEDLDGNNYSIFATIDGVEWGVPMQTGNRHYDEIMRQVNAGTLTIQDAD